MSAITLPGKSLFLCDIDPSLCASTREYVEGLPLDVEGLTKAIKALEDAPEDTTELSETQIECRLEIAQHFKEVCHYEDPTDPDENKVTTQNDITTLLPLVQNSTEADLVAATTIHADKMDTEVEVGWLNETWCEIQLRRGYKAGPTALQVETTKNHQSFETDEGIEMVEQ